jgi:hypothetical protein
MDNELALQLMDSELALQKVLKMMGYELALQ